MNQNEKLNAFLHEQKREAKTVWLGFATGLPILASVILYFISPPISSNEMIDPLLYGTSFMILIPIYSYTVWVLRKKYISLLTDLENPTLQAAHSKMRKLSRRYDDSSGVDFYLVKFGNGLKCHIKSDLAKRLAVGRGYIITHSQASKTVFEIKSQDNKTLISSKNIIRQNDRTYAI